jgi:hypothetical protein
MISQRQILDTQVEMELLGPGGIRPPWWLMIFHPMEGQHKPIGMERRPAAAERPPGPGWFTTPRSNCSLAIIQGSVEERCAPALSEPDHDLQLEY